MRQSPVVADCQNGSLVFPLDSGLDMRSHRSTHERVGRKTTADVGLDYFAVSLTSKPVRCLPNWFLWRNVPGGEVVLGWAMF